MKAGSKRRKPRPVRSAMHSDKVLQGHQKTIQAHARATGRRRQAQRDTRSGWQK